MLKILWIIKVRKVHFTIPVRLLTLCGLSVFMNRDVTPFILVLKLSFTDLYLHLTVKDYQNVSNETEVHRVKGVEILPHGISTNVWPDNPPNLLYTFRESCFELCIIRELQ